MGKILTKIIEYNNRFLSVFKNIFLVNDVLDSEKMSTVVSVAVTLTIILFLVILGLVLEKAYAKKKKEKKKHDDIFSSFYTIQMDDDPFAKYDKQNNDSK